LLFIFYILRLEVKNMRKFLPILVVGILVLSGLGAVAINIEKESNAKQIDNENIGDPKDYTHTVLVEIGSRKGCPSCPYANAAWKSIYAGGNYDFEYVHLIYQKNPKANQRFYSFNPAWVPTSYFDGGQYVSVGSNQNEFKNYLDSSGSRSVPDLVGEVNAMWLGNAKIDISISVENNDNSDYPGTLRVYVVEIISRWTDYNNQPYGHALLDFPWDQSIDINSGDTFEDNKVWDGAAAGYGDIEPDNIQVILTVCDDTAHTGYSDPPSGNPFNAYYSDELVATLVESNQPPGKTTVSGPTDVDPDVEYEYSFEATDPEGDDVRYYIDWGDMTEGWIGPSPSGEPFYFSHSWSENGIYEVKAKARDENYQEGPWSENLTVIVGNLAPEKPEISGNTKGKIGNEYAYTFVSTDPNGDQLSYYIKWGDETITEWTTPQASGTPYSEIHTWDVEGSYRIEAKAKDTDGAESDWAELIVTMPRNRAINTPFFKFLQNYQNLFQTLRLLLQLY
jgi:hypothetical protein